MSFGGFVQANTSVIVIIGPFVDVGDGFTPETGITLGAADEAELLKHGSSSVVDISGATWAAVTGCDGYYALTLTTSHTDTEGLLTVVVQDDSVCLPVKMTWQVIAQAAWASMITAKDSGYMDVNVNTAGGTAWGSGGISAASIAASALNGKGDWLLSSSTGTGLTAIPWNASWDAEVQSECADALIAYDPPTNAELEARTLAAADYATGASQTTIASYIDTEVAAIKAKTDNLPAAPAAAGDIPSAATVASQVRTELTTELGRIDAAVTSRSAAGDAMTLTSAYDFAKGTVAMSESYAADGATMTPAQVLHMIWALLAERSIVSTTLTAKKLDGSTAAMTFTLDSGTAPTAQTRST